MTRTPTHHVNLYYTFSITIPVTVDADNQAVLDALRQFKEGTPLDRYELTFQPQETQLYPVKIDDDDLMEKMIENLEQDIRHGQSRIQDLMDAVSGVDDWVRENYEDDAKEEAITASYDEADDARRSNRLS